MGAAHDLDDAELDDSIQQALFRLESIHQSAANQQEQISQRMERLEDKVAQYIADHESERSADDAKHRVERRWDIVHDIVCGAIGGIIVLLVELFILHK